MLWPPRQPSLPAGSRPQEVYDWEAWGWEASKGVRHYARLVLLSCPVVFAVDKNLLGLKPFDPVAKAIALYFAFSLLVMAVWSFICRRGLRGALRRARFPDEGGGKP